MYALYMTRYKAIINLYGNA